MINEYSVSIIVPIYNVEMYLERCILSILKQSYQDFELLLINDGSTDKSIEIAEKYVSENVKLFSKKNGGLSSARNYGIEKASGKYLCFIDSDDSIHENMIKTLISNLENDDADISICGYQLIYPDSIVPIVEGANKVIFNTEAALKVMLHRNSIGVIACNKMFKKDLFTNIRFPVGQHFEDINTIYKTVAKADKIVYDPVPLYNYYQNDNSINGMNFKNTTFNNRLYDMEIATDELYSYIRLNFSNCLEDVTWGCVDYYLRILNQEIKFNRKNDILKNKIREMMCSYVKKLHTCPYIKLKKKLQYYIFFCCYPLYRTIVKTLKN